MFEEIIQKTIKNNIFIEKDEDLGISLRLHNDSGPIQHPGGIDKATTST
jgi:hypothetical protein